MRTSKAIFFAIHPGCRYGLKLRVDVVSRIDPNIQDKRLHDINIVRVQLLNVENLSFFCYQEVNLFFEGAVSIVAFTMKRSFSVFSITVF